MAVKKVWVEDGCTLCGLCETQCPDVFELGEEKAEVKSGADLDANGDCIVESAEACPVDVIKYERD
jgi:ferredoxin